MLAISVWAFFLSGDNLQFLNIHAGFNSALKLVGCRCLNGNKAPNRLYGTGSQPGCTYGPGKRFTETGVGSELDPKFLRPGKAGRAPTHNQVSFIALKLYVVKSKTLVWRNWKGAADGKSSKSIHISEGSAPRSLWWPWGWGRGPGAALSQGMRPKSTEVTAV